MAIDPIGDILLSLSDASRLGWLQAFVKCHGLNAGREVRVATLLGWATHGLRGFHLETTRVRGTLQTSLEALQRFCENVSERSPVLSERQHNVASSN